LLISEFIFPGQTINRLLVFNYEILTYTILFSDKTSEYIQKS